MPEYDLEKRTTKFAEEVIFLCKSIKKDEVNRSIIN